MSHEGGIVNKSILTILLRLFKFTSAKISPLKKGGVKGSSCPLLSYQTVLLLRHNAHQYAIFHNPMTGSASAVAAVSVLGVVKHFLALSK